MKTLSGVLQFLDETFSKIALSVNNIVDALRGKTSVRRE